MLDVHIQETLDYGNPQHASQSEERSRKSSEIYRDNSGAHIRQTAVRRKVGTFFFVRMPIGRLLNDHISKGILLGYGSSGYSAIYIQPDGVKMFMLTLSAKLYPTGNYMPPTITVIRFHNYQHFLSSTGSAIGLKCSILRINKTIIQYFCG